MKILHKSSKKVSNVLTEPIAFYCKDCEKIGEVKPVGRKFVYKCAVCSTKNVAFGTEQAIRNYYRIEEVKVKKEDKGKKSEKIKKKEPAKSESKKDNEDSAKIVAKGVTKNEPVKIPEKK